MSSLNQLPLIIEMGALKQNFQGTPQELADAIAERLRIVSQQAFALFAAGTTEPAYDVGPWLDTSSSIGIWKAWSPVTGSYQPLPVEDVTLRYILSATEPDPTIYQLWIKLSPAGKGLGAFTWYSGAWHDIYEDAFATLASQIASILPTPGVAGTVLTSTGPSTPPVWQDQFFPGMVLDYAGSVVPSGLPWLICDGSLKAILAYPNLYNAIGTQYGGDALTTFAVPDCRGRGRAGVGTGDALGATPWTLGQKRGAEIHQLTGPEMPSHQHALTSIGLGNADGNDNASNQGVLFNSVGAGGALGNQTSAAGGDQGHNNISPMIGMNAIIRY